MTELTSIAAQVDHLVDLLREVGATDDEILWFFESASFERFKELYYRHNLDV